MSRQPPRYLTAVPPQEWFWEQFGSWAVVVYLAWEKRAQLVRAAERQNWRCCYCGARADVPTDGFPRPPHATREHVQPKSRQGSDEDDNIVMACMACNSLRGSSDPFSFAPPRARP